MAEIEFSTKPYTQNETKSFSQKGAHSNMNSGSEHRKTVDSIDRTILIIRIQNDLTYRLLPSAFACSSLDLPEHKSGLMQRASIRKLANRLMTDRRESESSLNDSAG